MSTKWLSTLVLAVGLSGAAAAPLRGEDPDKLLFTEICTLGTEYEFVEIYNPNDHDVDMSDYYLTDAIYSPGSQYYWRIAEGNPTSATVGGGAFLDFHARFPAGFTIAAGDTIVVTCPGSQAFALAFGLLPDLELFEDDVLPDGVPDMVPLWGDASDGSIVGPSSLPSLTNAAEIVILYHWHEGDDLVTDIDVFSWKDPLSITTSIFFDKTGVTVGSSTYGPDTPVADQHPFAAQLQFGRSYQRTDITEGNQTIGAGNGVAGRDETSEDFNATFTDTLAADPAGELGVLTVTLRPHASNILIPPTGGGFFFDVAISNNGIDAVTADVRILAILPDASEYPVRDVAGVPIPGGATVGRQALIQRVPALAPAGTYVYRCEVTTSGSPGIFYDEFPFEKMLVGEFAEPVTAWNLSGWEPEAESPVARQAVLSQASPNPFNPSTTITFDLPEQTTVSLRVYDLRGRLVRTLMDGDVLAQGCHDAIWNGRSDTGTQVAAGIYFYRLETAGFRQTKRVVLAK